MIRFSQDADERGFTLIELIVIMMIVGVLAVFASGRFVDEASFGARGYHDELASMARYAQRYAVASGCAVQFAINGANSGYALALAAPCPSGVGGFVQGADGNDAIGLPPTGVTVTSGAFSCTFDAYGDVSNGGTITVSGGGANLSFNITAGSGFVDVLP